MSDCGSFGLSHESFILFSMDKKKVSSYREHVQYTLENTKEPKFFSAQVIAKLIGPLMSLIMIVAFVYYIDSDGSFFWKYATILFGLFFLITFVKAILFKRSRLYSSWKDHVDENGVLSFEGGVVERTIDIMENVKRFKDIGEAEELHGKDVVDLLFLTQSYIQMPRTGGFVRNAKYNQ